ncbi:unnamed protein product [Caretta caretta]
MVWWKGPPLGHHQAGTIEWWSQYQGKAPWILERPLDLHKPLSSRPGVSKWTHTGIWWNVGWVAAVALWLGTRLNQLRKRVLLRYHGGALQLRPVDAKVRKNSANWEELINDRRAGFLLVGTEIPSAR